MAYTTTKKFVIFGNPVEHSLSPNMHNAGFKKLNIDASYSKYHLDIGKNLKETFLKNSINGANITVPYKEEAYKQADIIFGIANTIGAVNTYVKKSDKIIGYNTDAPGFIKAIEAFGELKNILLIGAGGTARAIAVALSELHIKVTVLNRSQNKLNFFQQLGCKTFTWENFTTDNFDLIVNSTSAGLKDEKLPFNEKKLKKIFSNANAAFDCIYGKETPFLKLAKKEGLKVKDGEDMLLYQGVLAFELFTNQKASIATIEAMRKGLKES